jgi:hypothetical protein
MEMAKTSNAQRTIKRVKFSTRLSAKEYQFVGQMLRLTGMDGPKFTRIALLNEASQVYAKARKLQEEAEAKQKAAGGTDDGRTPPEAITTGDAGAEQASSALGSAVPAESETATAE